MSNSPGTTSDPLDVLSTPLSVSEVAKKLNFCLEQTFPSIRFQGEVGQVTRASSGHIYFTMKDPDSERGNQLSCVMWRNAARTLSFPLAEGLAVVCIGRPNVYVVNGRLQIVAFKLIQSGEGLLQQRFQELHRRLAGEGLFEEARKRPLPFFPRTIGLVTSPTGAALHDMKVKLSERQGGLTLLLAPARVQGDGAAAEIARAIERVQQEPGVEVIIVARGGGSLQDLWAFNEEVVVRAIFASKVPVISGVGHEVDTTLTDLVADVRTPTPTAAAERAVPHREELLNRVASLEKIFLDSSRVLRPLEQSVDDLERAVGVGVESSLSRARILLQTAESHAARLHPLRVVSDRRLRIGHIETTLRGLGERRVSQKNRDLQLCIQRFERISPARKVPLAREKLDNLSTRLTRSVVQHAKNQRQLLRGLAVRYKASDPLAVLRRGYSLVWAEEKILRSVNAVEVDDTVAVQVADGRIEAVVRAK